LAVKSSSSSVYHFLALFFSLVSKIQFWQRNALPRVFSAKKSWWNSPVN